jgi:acetyltransferase-like isoleucine patch superfamily enzyme
MRFETWKQPYFDEDGFAYGDANMKKVYGWRCQYCDKLVLGDKTDIGCFTYINAKYGVVIGKNVQIGSHCSIYSENTENDTCGEVVIGDNVKIGSFCLILPNVHIADNTNIRARSNILSNNDLCVHLLTKDTTLEWIDMGSCWELRCRICEHVEASRKKLKGGRI